MKKIITILLSATLIFSMAACNSEQKETTAPPVVETTATETEYELSNEENTLLDLFDACAPEFPVMTWAVEKENKTILKRYTGLSDEAGLESVAITEGAMGEAYQVVLVKVSEGIDTKEVGKKMQEGFNAARWEDSADELIVAANDTYVLMVAMKSGISDYINAKDVVDQFIEMTEGAEIVATGVNEAALEKETTPAETTTAEADTNPSQEGEGSGDVVETAAEGESTEDTVEETAEASAEEVTEEHSEETIEETEE